MVSVVVPGQARGEHDVLSAGLEAPAPTGRRRLLAVAVAAGVVAVAGWQAGGPSGDVAETDRVEPVSLSLVTTVTSAAAVRRQDGAGFLTLRVRVALRNDGQTWITLDDVALGPYRASGDGLGALAPGTLTSVPLERLVVCGPSAPQPAPRFVEVDVLSAGGPSKAYLGLVAPAEVDPAALLPDCTA